MANNYYDILGVSQNASESEIKKAYRQLSKKYHPDMQGGKSDKEKEAAEEKFKEISHAYNVLSDPEKKSNYDNFGDENGQANPFGDFGGFGGFGGFNPFGDFGRSQRRRNMVEPGRDIQMKIPVTIEDLFNGCVRNVKFKRNVRCASCHGAGGSGQKTCAKCHGTGRFVTRQSFGMGGISIREEECPVCHGTGFTVEKTCDVCGGTGFKKVENKIEVKFPTGIQNGEYIIFNGDGHESKSPKGKNGDFIAIAEYNFDTDHYLVNGLDVIEHVYIPYYELLLGCTYTVDIPSGVSKKIKIASCIKDGTIMALRKEGLRRPDGQVGDYYVCIHYKMPEKISTNERIALESIAADN